MKGISMKKAAIAAVIAVFLAGSLYAGFDIDDIVYDPINYANQLLQYAQLIAAVEQLRLQYEFLLHMAETIPVDMETRYRAIASRWFSSTPPNDEFGLLSGWTAATNSGSWPGP